MTNNKCKKKTFYTKNECEKYADQYNRDPMIKKTMKDCYQCLQPTHRNLWHLTSTEPKLDYFTSLQNKISQANRKIP